MGQDGLSTKPGESTRILECGIGIPGFGTTILKFKHHRSKPEENARPGLVAEIPGDGTEIPGDGTES